MLRCEMEITRHDDRLIQVKARACDGEKFSDTIHLDIPVGGDSAMSPEPVKTRLSPWKIGPFAPTLVSYLKALQEYVHGNAVDHGFHDKPVDDGTKLMLIVSELSEALEALRNGNGPCEKMPEFSGLEEELADVVIRVFDFAGAKGLRLAEAIVAKHNFNVNRPHMHGGKAF